MNGKEAIKMLRTIQETVYLGSLRFYEAIDVAIKALEQPEEDCDTCKHGFFGSRQCDNCRVRYPSHYERVGSSF